MPSTSLELVHSYRCIYRACLQACQYSSPARYVLRSLVRNAYRNGERSDFNTQKLENTIAFLGYAAKERGLEHRILKTLLQTWWHGAMVKQHRPGVMKNKEEEAKLSRTSYDHFEATLKMLNESMGMCLPTSIRAAHWDGLPKERPDYQYP